MSVVARCVVYECLRRITRSKGHRPRDIETQTARDRVLCYESLERRRPF